MATNKKMDVPDIGGLLGKITEKRGELPKSPIQSVQPVGEKPVKSIPVKTPELQNSRMVKQLPVEVKGQGGRPSAKKDTVEYVKISPRVPKSLKRRVDIAIVEERFCDADGQSIKTLDEFVSYALEKLLK